MLSQIRTNNYKSITTNVLFCLFPLTSIIDASLSSRKDDVKNEKIRDQILKNSPEKNEEFFVVPKVIE